MPFSEEPRSRTDTAKRTSTAYVKFSPEYKVVLRILDKSARTVWKHWIPQANGGRGMTANCPNYAHGAQTNSCPIELSAAGLPADSEEAREKRARRKFVVNVLDRTPYATCPSCGTFTPGRKCQNCKADLKGAKFTPLNKVKILESGPQLFNQGLNAVERMQREDFDVDITEYDINFMTQGEGRDRKVQPLPQEPSPLPDDAFIDPDTGEPQALYRLDDLAEPNTIEEIKAMLAGATMDELNALRGIA